MKVPEAEKIVADELVGKNGRTPAEDAAVVLYQELRAVRRALGELQDRVKAVMGATPIQIYEHQCFPAENCFGDVIFPKEKEGWELCCFGDDCVWMRRQVR